MSLLGLLLLITWTALVTILFKVVIRAIFGRWL